MPITIPNDLPAREILENENVFIMSEQRAEHQDIRSLDILILNLMPKKIETETQLLRVLGNSPLQVNIELMLTSTHSSTHTPMDHLLKFYTHFDDIKDRYFDGMIITGAPVEHMEFEDVDYWGELCEIMEWSKTHVYSTFHICWAAQAALYYHYGIKKYPLPSKRFGIFKHTKLIPGHPLLRGFNDVFYAPHSRHTEIREEDVRAKGLDVLSTSPDAGLYLCATKDGRQIFVTGHSEYDDLTLDSEYRRDLAKGLPIEVPCNYYPDDNPEKKPLNVWRSHANLLYVNWLNYFVYQMTPYDFITKESKNDQ